MFFSRTLDDAGADNFAIVLLVIYLFTRTGGDTLVTDRATTRVQETGLTVAASFRWSVVGLP